MDATVADPDAGVPAVRVILRSRRDEPGGRWLGLPLVIAVHLVAAYLLLQYEPAQQTLNAVAPIMVDLVTPPRLVPAPPPPPPPPRRVQPKRLEPIRAPEPPPLIVAPTPVSEAEFVAPAAPPVTAAQVTARPVPAAPPDSPAPSPPVTPPTFDAAYLRNEPPAYPATSRRMAEQGRVLLRVLVSPAGGPEKVEVRTSSGFERLDRAALEAVRTWKFVPAQQAGRPVAAWVQIPLVFSLSR